MTETRENGAPPRAKNEAAGPLRPAAAMVRVRRYASLLAAGWISVVLLSLVWNIRQQSKEVHDFAVLQARRRFETKRSALVIRAGGREDTTLPISHIAAVLASEGATGRLLPTEELPPGALRAVNKSEGSNGGTVCRFSGIGEKEEVICAGAVRGSPKCARCHAAAGETGTVVGGLEVRVPVAPIRALVRRHIRSFYVSHAAVGLVGLLGIFAGAGRFARGVRERERLERARGEIDRRYGILVETSPLGIIAHSAGKIVFANREAARLIGANDPDELIGLPSLSFLHPSYRDVVAKRVNAIYDANEPAPLLEEKFVRTDGRIIDVEVAGIPIEIEGRPAVQVVFRDITNRKETERKLEEIRGRLRSVIERAPVILWALDRDGVFTLSEGDGLKHFGLKPGEIVGRSIWDLFGEHHDTIEMVKRALRGEEVSGDSEVAGRVWDSSYIPIRDEGENVTGMSGISFDVTDRKNIEKEREALITELETKNAELERFTYTVSHDLKSPLITIRGYIDLLARDIESDDRGKVAADIDFIAGAAGRMKRLLDELLELSRIGRTVNPEEDVDFGGLASDVARLLEGRLHEERVSLRIEPALPRFRCDKTRMFEVLQNLVDNAIRFSAFGAERVVTIGARAGDDGPVCFVKDNGIGIEARYREKIFDLFEQLDPARGGTGVGLALTKKIIEAHGGTIWVESEGTGHGSTFCFALPGRELPDEGKR